MTPWSPASASQAFWSLQACRPLQRLAPCLLDPMLEHFPRGQASAHPFLRGLCHTMQGQGMGRCPRQALFKVGGSSKCVSQNGWHPKPAVMVWLAVLCKVAKVHCTGFCAEWQSLTSCICNGRHLQGIAVCA